MSAIDTEGLLEEISAEEPSGPDLEYDAAFGELERAARGGEEQQIGDSIIEAEEPDWKQVKQLAQDLFSRSKDLRVALYLTRALLKTDELTGFRDALTLLSTMLERYWDSVHPQLDPDDDNDPTMRMNILTALCDGDGLLKDLRVVPLVSSRALGRFSLRDIAVASGEMEQPSDAEGPAPSMATIDGAFMDADLEELQARAAAVQETVAAVNAIETYTTEQVGAGNAISLGDLAKVLGEANTVFTEQLSRLGVGEAAGESAEEASAEGAEPSESGAGQPRRITGEIASREDVVRMLDKVIQYYDKYEPTSPVPILMTRAKRLATMNFMEIIGNIAPDGLPQIEVIRGPEEAQDEQPQQDDGW